MWDFSRDALDRLVVFATKKAEGSRTDTDRVVARITTNGALDETFNANPAANARKGFYALDIGGLGDSARHGLVQPDGKSCPPTTWGSPRAWARRSPTAS